MELDDTSPYWTGEALHELMQRLFPICRSITGKGVRETLDIIGEHIPLERFEVPSGTQVFDWEVPLEWNINEAWIKDTDGRKVVDFRDHNLHVMSYSQSVDETLPLDALKPHLHSLPDQPDLIPYRTSYYADNWGFCLTHNQLAALPAGDYRVKIDSTHSQGALSYGEYFLPGETDREIVLYTHVCHPSLCNDNLSGITIGTALGQWLGQRKRRYSYRIVFAPGTIGSITWLAQNQDRLDKVDCALVAVLLGGPGNFTYKRSRFGSAYIDRVVELALRDSEQDHEIVDFSPYGYDERQFNSPGIKIPAGRITRSPNGTFPEYHTSADNLDFVTPTSLVDSLGLMQEIIDILENDATYLNTEPMCEPQLGRRGLYTATGGKNIADRQLAMLWMLNQSDGGCSVVDVAWKSGVAFTSLSQISEQLKAAGLLVPGSARAAESSAGPRSL